MATEVTHDAKLSNLEVTGATLFDTVTVNPGNSVNRSTKSTGRYYLEEWFKQRPALNAVNIIDPDADDAAALAATQAANKDFEILGTNASTDDVTFSATRGGIQLQTDGADNDQVIILPHLDTNQTAWTGVKWGTENQVEWECLIHTDASVATMALWAGLKLTNTPVYATDADQAYFLYSTDDDMGALTTNANLHFIYSVGGTDYISDLGIAVAANTSYHLKIVINSSRQATVYVNGTQYSLTSDTTAGGVAVSAGNTLSTALTNDVNLIPYIGIQSLAADVDTLHVSYEAINRDIYE